MYTTLAGFVEVGEAFEDAVRREVFERNQYSRKIFAISVALGIPKFTNGGLLADI